MQHLHIIGKAVYWIYYLYFRAPPHTESGFVHQVEVE